LKKLYIFLPAIIALLAIAVVLLLINLHRKDAHNLSEPVTVTTTSASSIGSVSSLKTVTTAATTDESTSTQNIMSIADAVAALPDKFTVNPDTPDYASPEIYEPSREKADLDYDTLKNLLLSNLRADFKDVAVDVDLPNDSSNHPETFTIHGVCFYRFDLYSVGPSYTGRLGSYAIDETGSKIYTDPAGINEWVFDKNAQKNIDMPDVLYNGSDAGTGDTSNILVLKYYSFSTPNGYSDADSFITAAESAILETCFPGNTDAIIDYKGTIQRPIMFKLKGVNYYYFAVFSKAHSDESGEKYGLIDLTHAIWLYLRLVRCQRGFDRVL
jgi:hypothetical protein